MSAGCVSGCIPVPGKGREEPRRTLTTAQSGAGLSGRVRVEPPVLSSGGTLFRGGPGARSHSDFGAVIESVRTRLLTLSAGTEVLTGQGEPTTVGAESSPRQEWIARGP